MNRSAMQQRIRDLEAEVASLRIQLVQTRLKSQMDCDIAEIAVNAAEKAFDAWTDDAEVADYSEVLHGRINDIEARVLRAVERGMEGGER